MQHFKSSNNERQTNGNLNLTLTFPWALSYDFPIGTFPCNISKVPILTICDGLEQIDLELNDLDLVDLVGNLERVGH